MKYNNSKFAIWLPILLSLSLIGGMFLDRLFKSPVEKPEKRITVAPGGHSKIDALLEYIAADYVDTMPSDSILEKAIPHIIDELDPHSEYIPASEFNDANDPLEGEFEGIGVQFNIRQDTVVIVQVISGGPSERVNLRAGDRIVKVNDSIIAGVKITNNGVMRKLKGPKGTKVKVGIKRANASKLIDFLITRDKIPLYSIDAAFMVAPVTGYIKINRFAVNTYQEFMEKLEILRPQGMKNLVIDLRGNGGGVLTAATDIANEFLEKGDKIVYIEGKAYERQEIFANGQGSCTEIKLTVLVDEGTASASEILSGAIQDNDRGTIVGVRTFGKGLVMDQRQFADGSALRLTVARYYTPSGRCIQKPYKPGQRDEYYSEVWKRYGNGELENADSIKKTDTVKYKTKNGRIVYGGGGIVPDVFVPLDTTHTKFTSEVISKGLLYDFAFEFTDRNRSKTQSIKNLKSFENWYNTQNIYSQFLQFVKKHNVKAGDGNSALNQRLLGTKLKAFVARNIIGDEAFFEIILHDDKTFDKGLLVVQKK